MSDETKPMVLHRDVKGVRWVRVMDKKLGWSMDSRRLKAALLEAIAGATRVAVDLSEVVYVSSMRLGALLSFNRDAVAAGCKVVYYGMQKYVHETFDGLGLSRVLTIRESKEDASEFLRG